MNTIKTGLINWKTTIIGGIFSLLASCGTTPSTPALVAKKSIPAPVVERVIIEPVRETVRVVETKVEGIDMAEITDAVSKAHQEGLTAGSLESEKLEVMAFDLSELVEDLKESLDAHVAEIDKLESRAAVNSSQIESLELVNAENSKRADENATAMAQQQYTITSMQARYEKLEGASINFTTIYLIIGVLALGWVGLWVAKTYLKITIPFMS